MWRFVDSTPMIEVSIRNPLLEKEEPINQRAVMAVLDTGYSGFLLIPEKLFKTLRLHKLRSVRVRASLANGSSAQFTGSYGSVDFPTLNNLRVDGLIETGQRMREILIGMEGIKRLLIELDCCRETLRAQECSF